MTKRITPLLAAAAALTAAAVLLIAAELLLAGHILAAVGTVLLGPVVGVMLWKQQATIVSLQRLRQGLGQSESGRRRPATTSPAPQVSPDPGGKLRRVGVWTPPKTTYSATQGRAAAQVAADPDAPFRLFAATTGFGSPDVSDVTPRSIALVGSDALAERLRSRFTVQRLHPRVSAAELAHARPATLVVEEDSLDGGPWAGALDPAGSALLTEIRQAQQSIRDADGICYVIPGRRARLGAPALRAEAMVVAESVRGEDGGRAPLLDILLEHSDSKAASE